MVQISLFFYFCINPSSMCLLFSNANFGSAQNSLFLGLVMEEAVSRYNGKGWNSLGTFFSFAGSNPSIQLYLFIYIVQRSKDTNVRFALLWDHIQKKDKQRREGKGRCCCCLIQFFAVLANLQQDYLKNRKNSSFSLNRPTVVQNSQRGKELNQFCTASISNDLCLLLYLSFFYVWNEPDFCCLGVRGQIMELKTAGLISKTVPTMYDNTKQ